MSEQKNQRVIPLADFAVTFFGRNFTGRPFKKSNPASKQFSTLSFNISFEALRDELTRGFCIENTVKRPLIIRRPPYERKIPYQTLPIVMVRIF